MLRVHCYHEPVPGLQPADRLISLWKRNWTQHGFEPVVLGQRDAETHPGYSYFLDRINRFPSSNPREYERACFLRHLAMANIGGGLLVDYDVICREKADESEFSRLPAHPVLLEPTRVPCAVLGSQEAFEELCDILCEYQPNGERHVSDMTILRKTNLQAESMCVEHLDSARPIVDDPGDGWKKAPMIHFSNFSFSKLGWSGDKADMIQRVLDTL